MPRPYVVAAVLLALVAAGVGMADYYGTKLADGSAWLPYDLKINDDLTVGDDASVGGTLTIDEAVIDTADAGATRDTVVMSGVTAAHVAFMSFRDTALVWWATTKADTVITGGAAVGTAQAYNLGTMLPQ
jgi:hypothetical protein